MSQNLSLIRCIISEFRRSIPKENLKDNLTLQYIIKEFRKYKTTDEQLCKAKLKMTQMAQNYLCYLQSNRLSQEIHAEYHGKGERSVEDTAKMVGFKLPHDPK